MDNIILSYLLKPHLALLYLEQVDQGGGVLTVNVKERKVVKVFI